MTYNERKNYLLYTSIAFVVGAFLYSILAIFMVITPSAEFSSFTKALYFISSILIGGYLICSILSGILIFISFIKKQTKKTKILMIVFFMFTIQAIIFSGFFATLPYYVYNLHIVRKRRYIIEKWFPCVCDAFTVILSSINTLLFFTSSCRIRIY